MKTETCANCGSEKIYHYYGSPVKSCINFVPQTPKKDISANGVELQPSGNTKPDETFCGDKDLERKREKIRIRGNNRLFTNREVCLLGIYDEKIKERSRLKKFFEQLDLHSITLTEDLKKNIGTNKVIVLFEDIEKEKKRLGI